MARLQVAVVVEEEVDDELRVRRDRERRLERRRTQRRRRGRVAERPVEQHGAEGAELGLEGAAERRAREDGGEETRRLLTRLGGARCSAENNEAQRLPQRRPYRGRELRPRVRRRLQDLRDAGRRARCGLRGAKLG